MLILVKVFVLPYNRPMVKTTQIIKKLNLTKKTLSVAESCTGGLLGHTLTNIPGSSGSFLGGVIAYQNGIKQKFLSVPESLLKTHGAVSEPVAMAMAAGARQKFKSDFGIGISGIAGPGGGTDQKPVGLTYIAVASPSESVCAKCIFKGTRLQIKKQAADKALDLLAEFL